ncbi:hypothetical protein SDC9_141357 [bioreactor metagenome]|uniref:Uncharacterized protein n=1 Tax=bioreactor metagenome TaxID=1076179 RepID=A0A645E0U7_9ZZZZ
MVFNIMVHLSDGPVRLLLMKVVFVLHVKDLLEPVNILFALDGSEVIFAEKHDGQNRDAQGDHGEGDVDAHDGGVRSAVASQNFPRQAVGHACDYAQG